MSEPVQWQADGTPRSPRFDDTYRSSAGGLEQARHVFLGGCGLPGAWAGRAQWRILETGFGLGLNFLAAWRAWKDDPQRPRLLHFVSIEAWPVSPQDILRSAAPYPELHEPAQALADQWGGLVGGFHRLSFEGGRVLLTLCVGDVAGMLREQSFATDSVFLDGFDPRRNAPMWELPTLKAVTRLCRRGTGLATWTVAGAVRRDLAQCGFQVDKAEGLPPKRECLRARFEPVWQPKGQVEDVALAPGRCVVVGAGLSGAAAAASLARRGWQVQVLDAAAQPASGASAVPVGLLAPHQSPDDNLLSRLSRAGVRTCLQQARELLREDEEWQATGVLQHRLDDPRPLPDLGSEGLPWARPADAAQTAQGLLDEGAHAWWHAQAAWIKPAGLVRAWLAQPGINWAGNTRVAAVRRQGPSWLLLDGAQRELARADLVVIAAAHASAELIDVPLALQPVRGQIAWAPHEAGQALPAFPLNGNGHFVPGVPLNGRPSWVTGSTYGRGDADAAIRAGDQLANLERLRGLAPALAQQLAGAFERGAVHAWAGVRCTSADRRPLVGPVRPGLWLNAAMGSRGLTFAHLCAELMAARLHGEPLPLGRKPAQALSLERHVGPLHFS